MTNTGGLRTRYSVFRCVRCKHDVQVLGRRRIFGGGCPKCGGGFWIRRFVVPPACSAPCEPKCERVSAARGLCQYHYARLLDGKPIDRPAPPLGGDRGVIKEKGELFDNVE